MRSFKLANDRKFAEKLKDVVGFYIDPTAHAVVLNHDEKSQIQATCSSQRQALAPIQSVLPMKRGVAPP